MARPPVRSIGWFAICVIAAVMATPARAASDTGAIVGFVFDQTGMPLAGVKVSATSADRPVVKATAATDAEGAFRVSKLRPGRFTV